MNPVKALTLKGLNETCLNLLKQAPNTSGTNIVQWTSCANPHKSCIPAQPCPWLMQQLNEITLCAHVRYVILLSISTGTDFRQPVDLKGDVIAMEYVLKKYLSAIFSGWWRASVGVISKRLLMSKRLINVAHLRQWYIAYVVFLLIFLLVWDRVYTWYLCTYFNAELYIGLQV